MAGRYAYGLFFTETTDDLELAIREETGNVLADSTVMYGLIRDDEAHEIVVAILRPEETLTDAQMQATFPKARIIRLRASGALDGYDLH